MRQGQDSVVNVNTLCRVCLTHSTNMVLLEDVVDCKYDGNKLSVREVLCRFLKSEVSKNHMYPQAVCAICVSLLKIAYEFRIQYENTERTLIELLGNDADAKEVSPDSNTDQSPSKEQSPVKEEQSSSEESQSPIEQSPVEIIINGNVYSLDELIIVENEDENGLKDYSGFLKNLGTEISATFVNKRYKRLQAPTYQNEITLINKTQLQTDNNVTENTEIVVVQELISNERNTETDNNIVSNESNDGTELIEIPELYKCHVCNNDKVYNREKFLIHTRRHKRKPKQHVCNQCGHISQTNWASKLHEEKHLGKQYKCETCDKAYYNKNALVAHMNKHSQKQTFLCNWCGKVFLYANALKYHIRLHTGEKNYLCRYCGKRCTVHSALIRHMRTHTGSKPYQCGFCNRNFASIGEKKCHEMGHTGYRPYHCKYCNRGFTKMHNMKVHLMSHSGPHVCELCSKTFIEMVYLKKHLKIVHKIDDETLQTEEDLPKGAHAIDNEDLEESYETVNNFEEEMTAKETTYYIENCL